ncbi:hypothetical protein DWA44_14375 [Klebsiella pneumoniae]|nr:hypothetical protein DWA46_17055 [Klebsiella pneumoniae]RDG57026.1 hypothetical protein DWA45_00650 [Klebsiella pneumoniae]RDG63854.1 hypothetical protein DWA43_07260 [Klebsiella pneumoniae]RDG67711.1 hypothetical protein DWA44_14375 [Klebsiella pneumoniae]RDG78511.1 hypothetical protein DWA40_08670 [Klebsiella pneumoniae]
MSACVNPLASHLRNQQNQRATRCNFSDGKSGDLLQLDAFCRSGGRYLLSSVLYREAFRAPKQRP